MTHTSIDNIRVIYGDKTVSDFMAIIAETESHAKRVAIALSVFGRSGVEILSLLSKE